MPTNLFYNAIQQLRQQKEQRDTPKAQAVTAPVQTPELDKATGNTAQSAPALQISPRWKTPGQSQQTQTPSGPARGADNGIPVLTRNGLTRLGTWGGNQNASYTGRTIGQVGGMPSRREQSAEQTQTQNKGNAASRLGGNSHQRRTSTQAVNLAGETAPKGKSPASATGKYDSDSTKATGIDNGVPVLTSYDGFKRLDRGVSNSVGDPEANFFTLERAKNIGEAALTGTAAGYTGAARALYEAGQGRRDRENQEMLAELEPELARQTERLEYFRNNLGEDSEEFVSQQNLVKNLQLQVDAMRKVVDENLEQRAAQAASELTHELEQRSAAATERAKEGTGKIGEIAVDAAINMLQMGGDALAGIATGGSTLLPMGVRVFGQGASEAEQAGADINRQLLFATTAAGIEVFTEKLFDGVAQLYGKGAADEITETLVGKLARTDAGRSALRAFLGMNEEGLEEAISDILTPAAKTIYNGQGLIESYKNNFNIADTLYNYVIGAAAAGGMQAVQLVTSYRNNQQANAELRAKEEARNAETAQEEARQAAWREFFQQGANPRAQEAAQMEAEQQRIADTQTEAQQTLTPIAETVLGQQEADQREPTPGTNPRADEQAQLEEALNTPQAPESEDATEGQAGTSPIAEAILQGDRRADVASRMDGIEDRAKQIWETPYEDEFYGTVQHSMPFETALGSEKFSTYLSALGVDIGEALNNRGASSMWSFLNDLVSHGGDLPPLAAAQTFAEFYDPASQTAKGNYRQVLERAYEIAGKQMPEGIRREYMPTEAERAEDNRHDAARRKGIDDYKRARDKQQTARAQSEAMDNPQEAGQEQPVQVGRATTIYHPYNGKKPTQNYTRAAPTAINGEQLTAAQNAYNQATTGEQTGQGPFKTLISRLYSAFKGPKSVDVNGMDFNGSPYLVDVPNGLPGKLASQRSTAEAFSILDSLSSIIQTGEYLGSGQALTEDGQPKKSITRYDYFESEITIDGKPYIVKWEVENVPGGNNYKIHRLVNIEIDPASTDGPPANSGRNPINAESTKGGAETPTPTDNVTQIAPTVNGENTPPTPPQTPPTQTPGTQQAGTNPFQNQEQNQQGGRTGIQPVDRGADQNGDLTGTKVSQTAETVRRAKPTTEDFAALMNREMENGAYRYFPITNDESVNRAIETITDKGWDKALFDWEKDVYKGVAGDQMTSIGALLYNNAVNSGNTALASEILSYYVSLGRSTARGLQAFRILKDMDPSTRLYGMLGGVREMSEKYTHDPDAIQIDSDMAERYRTAATEEERDAVFDEIMDDLARQITEKRAWDVSVKEMWTALRYLNMLGNLRTQARNIGGNTAAAAAFTAKYYVQNALERIAKKATHGAYQANTAVNVGEYMDAARQDAKAMEDYVLGEQKYGDTQSPTSELTRRAEDKHRIFAINTKSEKLNKAVNTLLWVPEGHRLGTQWAMNKGDTLFSLPRYARALAGYVKAHGMDAATFSGIINGTIEATTEQSRMLDDARAFATKEAQEATFRDTNKLSSWVSKVGRRKDTWSPIKILSEGTSPFRKTPVNVAIRAEEFSPLGWFNTLVLEAERRLGKGNVQLSDVLNSASKSLTGTGIFLLGMLLRKLKWITGSEDDDKQKKFNELQGWQEWALNLPNGKNITIDWSTPNSIPLFMGAALMDAIDENGFNLDAFKDAIPGISQVMLKQSMLQGINDALNTVKRDYNSNNAIEPLVVQGALSYLFQGITSTFGGQLERITEDRRYTTWRDPESKGTWGTLKYQLDRATAKIPGLDRNQIEYVDAWGRPEYTGTLGERAFENAISPGYSSKYDSTEVDDELQRLYDAGMSNVFPQTTAASEKIPTFDSNGRKDGERYMTADELVRYQKVRGQTSLEMVKDLMDSSVYDSMTDEAKAAAISEIYSYAKNQAARAVEKTVPNSYGDITRTSNPAAYIGMQKAFSTATSDKYNRDYDAVDDLMEQYGKMPMDVRKLLGEKVDGLSKVYEASQAGISSKTYYTTTDAIKAITPPDGNANPVLWQKAEYIGGLKHMPDSQKDFFMEQYFEGGSITKYQDCRNQGYRPQDIAEYYKLTRTINGDDKNGDGKADKNSKRDKVITAAVKYGFSQAQAEYLWTIWG